MVVIPGRLNRCRVVTSSAHPGTVPSLQQLHVIAELRVRGEGVHELTQRVHWGQWGRGHATQVHHELCVGKRSRSLLARGEGQLGLANASMPRTPVIAAGRVPLARLWPVRIAGTPRLSLDGLFHLS